MLLWRCPSEGKKVCLFFKDDKKLSRAKVCREVEILYVPLMMGPGVDDGARCC